MRCSTANANSSNLYWSQTFVGSSVTSLLEPRWIIYHLDTAGPALWLRGACLPHIPYQIRFLLDFLCDSLSISSLKAGTVFTLVSSAPWAVYGEWQMLNAALWNDEWKQVPCGEGERETLRWGSHGPEKSCDLTGQPLAIVNGNNPDHVGWEGESMGWIPPSPSDHHLELWQNAWSPCVA